MILVTCHCGKSAKQLYIGLLAMTIPTIINMFRACTVQYKKTGYINNTRNHKYSGKFFVLKYAWLAGIAGKNTTSTGIINWSFTQSRGMIKKSLLKNQKNFTEQNKRFPAYS